MAFLHQIAEGNFPGLPDATPFIAPGQLLAYLEANPDNALNVFAVDRFLNLGGIHARIYAVTGGYDVTAPDGSKVDFGSSGTIFDSISSRRCPDRSSTDTRASRPTGAPACRARCRPRASTRPRNGRTTRGRSILAGNTVVAAVTDIGPGGIVFETSKTLKAKPVRRM